MLLILCALVSWSSFAYPENKRDAEARIIRVTGDVRAFNRLDGTTRSLKPGDILEVMDTVVVEAKSKATIRLDDSILIYLGSETVLGVEALRYYPNAEKSPLGLRVVQGAMRLVTNSRYNHRRRPLRLNIPHASVGVRGTRFWMDVITDGSPSPISSQSLVEFLCLKPTCVMTNEVNRRVMDKPNQFMMVTSRFERLPRPRPATAFEVEYANSLTPAFPEPSGKGKKNSDWSVNAVVVGENGSGSGGAGGGAGGQSSSTQENDSQEEQEKKENKRKESFAKDLDWESILVTLGVFAVLALTLVGAWYLDKKRRG